MVRARNSVRSVRQSLRRMIEEDPEPAVKSNLMARMAAANAETEDALEEIERISQRVRVATRLVQKERL
jgi:hypothetical protein